MIRSVRVSHMSKDDWRIPTAPWTELSDRERDVLTALAMGTPVERLFIEDTAQGSLWRNWSPTFPSYTTDPAATKLVEDEIERRGLWAHYCSALADIVGFDGRDYDDHGAIALRSLISATPEQRCRAALQVL